MKLKRVLIIGFGWVFIVGGIIGLFLPVVQGAIMIFIGLNLLSFESVWAKRLLNKIKQRYPSLGQKLDQAKAWLKKIIGGRNQRRIH